MRWASCVAKSLALCPNYCFIIVNMYINKTRNTKLITDGFVFLKPCPVAYGFACTGKSQPNPVAKTALSNEGSGVQSSLDSPHGILSHS